MVGRNHFNQGNLPDSSKQIDSQTDIWREPALENGHS